MFNKESENQMEKTKDYSLGPESRDRIDDIISNIAREIQYILNLKYSPLKPNGSIRFQWVTRFEKHRNRAIDYMLWGFCRSYKEHRNYIDYIRDNLQYIYTWGNDLHCIEVRRYTGLVPGLTLIPVTCPWTLEQLMNDSIKLLLSKLRDE